MKEEPVKLQESLLSTVGTGLILVVGRDSGGSLGHPTGDTRVEMAGG